MEKHIQSLRGIYVPPRNTGSTTFPGGFKNLAIWITSRIGFLGKNVFIILFQKHKKPSKHLPNSSSNRPNKLMGDD